MSAPKGREAPASNRLGLWPAESSMPWTKQATLGIFAFLRTTGWTLRGDRQGQHSIRINNQYRICFCWTGSGPDEVEIVDYR
jgi:hypothetical protein